MKDITKHYHTPRIKEVFALAAAHAREHRQPMVGPPHLLIALIKFWEGVHVPVLESVGFRKDEVLREAEILAAKYSEEFEGTEYSSEFLDRVERARYFAEDLKHSYVGTEHLLLSLVEGSDPVGNLLRNHGLKLARLHAGVIAELDPGLYNSFRPLSVSIDPGTAPKEAIADILSDLSAIYRLRGGSGITFEVENIQILAGSHE